MKEEIKLETKCETCLECNRLELEDFKGVYRCENYIKGRETKDEQSGDSI